MFGVLIMNIKRSLNFFYSVLRIICFAFLGDRKKPITLAYSMTTLASFSMMA